MSKPEGIRKIRIVEVAPSDDGIRPTGREILMAEDSPLFDQPGWQHALGMGMAACGSEAFQSIADIIKEAEENQDAKT